MTQKTIRQELRDLLDDLDRLERDLVVARNSENLAIDRARAAEARSAQLWAELSLAEPSFGDAARELLGRSRRLEALQNRARELLHGDYTASDAWAFVREVLAPFPGG